MPLIDNIIVRCFAAYERTASPSTRRAEVRLRLGGGEVFGTSSFSLRDSPATLRGGLFNTLACHLPHTRYRHNSLHQCPRQGDLQFQGPCHCNLRPRIPVNSPLFYVLALGAALGPLRPQKRASGAVWRFFCRVGVWHTADPPLTIPVDAQAPANGVSRQPPPPHGSLHSAAFGAWSIASL